MFKKYYRPPLHDDILVEEVKGDVRDKEKKRPQICPFLGQSPKGLNGKLNASQHWQGLVAQSRRYCVGMGRGLKEFAQTDSQVRRTANTCCPGLSSAKEQGE
jgi:hypothetical protein